MATPSRTALLPRALAIVVAAFGPSCAPAAVQGTDPWVAPVYLEKLGPTTVLPNTVIRISGAGFLDPEFGANRVHFVGKTRSAELDLVLTARYVDSEHLELDVDEAFFSALGGDGGGFGGVVRIEVENLASGAVRASNAIEYGAAAEDALQPELTSLETNITVYVNDPIGLGGRGFLLGGPEGTTYARVAGCFYPEGATSCTPVTPQQLAVVPTDPVVRSGGAFPFSVTLVGIRPGLFRGTLSLVNAHGSDGSRGALTTDEVQFELTVRGTEVTGLDTTEASLGQYVEVTGGGFVGDVDTAITLLEVAGDFFSEGTENARPVDLLLVPEFAGGRRLRYVLNEEDSLGQTVNLRREAGLIEGTAVPVTRYQGDERRGPAMPFSFRIAPLKQVVTVVFLPSYVESLGRFGLRAMDGAIRERALAAARGPYEGVNVEFRTELPTDFALYSVVEISGVDPNDQGLFGYDNTPGKDTNNLRLTDRIGGVNAQTQADGFPGYGGVFIDSFFEFRSGGDIADPLFDELFDPFLPKRGGSPVDAEDLKAGIEPLADGTTCGGTKLERPARIACAVWALGSLVGSTLAHEVGHSLGLANPYDPMEFHNVGDQPMRLMDPGGARPFRERVDIDGQGSAQFCDEEYAYLREIMPRGEPSPAARPTCF